MFDLLPLELNAAGVDLAEQKVLGLVGKYGDEEQREPFTPIQEMPVGLIIASETFCEDRGAVVSIRAMVPAE